MVAKSDTTERRPLVWVVVAAVVILGAWAFPPFHVVRLAPAATEPVARAPGTFDAKAVAAQVWRDQLPAAAAKAPDVNVVVAALRKNADGAKTQYGKSVGVGAAYFFVRGRGQVVAHERNQITVALEGAAGEVVALRIGPVFGNTVRDGCGLLDLNSFPGLAEFNALSAELNTLVEQNILPVLRQQAPVGATVTFAGCAEAPDTAADAGEPVLTIIPVEARLP